jgi:hypothetical protein
MGELQDSKREWAGLAAQGGLLLDPAIGGELRAAADDLLVVFADAQSRLRPLASLQGFGGFATGRALQRKFEQKASGTGGSLDAVLAGHAATVREMQTALAASIARAIAQDHSAAVQLDRQGE